MIDNIGMYQNYSVEGELKIKNDESMKCDYNDMCKPIHECPIQRCVHKHIVHDVNHIVPIHTRIINHHVYRHTYTPCYTCCEENEVCNVNDNKCML